MTSLTYCNLIAGFVDSGKTTVIRRLIDQRPQHEHWAVLLNEHGKISIAGSEFGDGAVTVRQVIGGCLCCSANVQLRVELTRLLREVRPHRLLIEPLSSGHLGAVLDLLRAPDFHNALVVGPTLCVMDPAQFSSADLGSREDYREQIALADVAVINKVDLASEQQLAAARSHVRGLRPAKAAIVETAHGRIDAALLSAPTRAAQSL